MVHLFPFLISFLVLLLSLLSPGAMGEASEEWWRNLGFLHGKSVVCRKIVGAVQGDKHVQLLVMSMCRFCKLYYKPSTA